MPFWLTAEMNVGRAAGIVDGFDGAEIVAAVGGGKETAITLEILVALVLVVVVRVQVNAVSIDLPDFDEGVANRFARGAKNAAG